MVLRLKAIVLSASYYRIAQNFGESVNLGFWQGKHWQMHRLAMVTLMKFNNLAHFLSQNLIHCILTS